MAQGLRMLLAASMALVGAQVVDAAEPTTATLTSFGSEAQLDGFVRQILQRRQAIASEAAARRRAQLEAYRKANPLAGKGAVIVGSTRPGARVSVSEYSGGFDRSLVADAQGRYAIHVFWAGSYWVTADGITRNVRVGAAGAAGAPLEVASVESTTILTTDQIAAIPVPRDVTSVALLAPGTVSADGITNVQTAGVDEGGIVKKSGDFLVVLRRGRLFSIRADGKSLDAVSSSNAYGPATEGDDAWYDEMLISGRTIVVVGYSYKRGGTEVGLFDLGPDGHISYRATYQLLSNDYYSSRNYASRLIGNTLVFYAPLDLYPYGSDQPRLPAMRRWKPNPGPFRPIGAAERVYRSELGEADLNQTLHTVTRCELGDGEMDCRSTIVIGPESSVFYVSADAVFVALEYYGETGNDPPLGSLIRMPLDGSAPSALRVVGSPIDQMSFLEKDGWLNVLVGAEAEGLRMWSAEGKSGGLALLRVPLGAFGDAKAWSRPEHYQPLPSGSKDEGFWRTRNRYVGDWLVYGGAQQDAPAYALRIDRPMNPVELRPGHAVERIEGMGADALLVGEGRGGLGLSSVALDESARIASRFNLPATAQGDERSHGFFYQPRGPQLGVFGLPVVQGDEKHQRASVRFLRNSRLRLSPVGALEARPRDEGDDDADDCVASCYDWYGNARPIFIGDRVYGLLGYELIEGTLANGRIHESRRIDFSPAAAGH